MMLEVDGIDVPRGDSLVLRGVSLAVPAGEILTVLGRNGAGKTTTLRAIVGLSPPARGAIRLDRQDVTRKPPHVLTTAGIGYLPESHAVLPSFTVHESLRLVTGRRAGPWTVQRVLDMFPRLTERLEHRGDQLSGGEQQMLGIATALLLNPRVLLLDEPTHGLAPRLVSEIGNRITAIAETGVAVVLVEQNFRFATSLASHAAVLGKGRVQWSGTVPDLVRNQEVQSTWVGI